MKKLLFIALSLVGFGLISFSVFKLYLQETDQVIVTTLCEPVLADQCKPNYFVYYYPNKTRD